METLTKIDAINAVYTRIKAMLKDGKKIYRRNAAKKAMFSYDSLLAKIKGPGKTGIRIKLLEDIILNPITTATLYVVPTGRTFRADDKGFIENDLTANTYKYTLTAPGYITIEGKFTVTPGVMHRKTFKLVKAGQNNAVVQNNVPVEDNVDAEKNEPAENESAG